MSENAQINIIHPFWNVLCDSMDAVSKNYNSNEEKYNLLNKILIEQKGIFTRLYDLLAGEKRPFDPGTSMGAILFASKYLKSAVQNLAENLSEKTLNSAKLILHANHDDVAECFAMYVLEAKLSRVADRISKDNISIEFWVKLLTQPLGVIMFNLPAPDCPPRLQSGCGFVGDKVDAITKKDIKLPTHSGKCPRCGHLPIASDKFTYLCGFCLNHWTMGKECPNCFSDLTQTKNFVKPGKAFDVMGCSNCKRCWKLFHLEESNKSILYLHELCSEEIIGFQKVSLNLLELN